MSACPALYILRHGETAWNLEGRLQGRFDSELTPTGIAQAQAQNAILKRCDLDGFVAISSPQGRAFATAQIALKGVLSPIKQDAALSEVGLGEWAGQSRAEMMGQTGAADGFALYDLAPGGEGLQALRLRCEAFLRNLERPAVLVTHGITSRMLRLILTEQPNARLRQMQGGQGVVFHLADGRQKRLTIGA